MHPWRPDALKLKFGDFINRKKLPKVPAVYGHIKGNDVPWQMLANDQYGDCVLAGACHEIMTWALATQRPMPDFNNQTVVSQYLALTGGKDAGLDPVATAKWRVSTGVEDTGGVFHKVKAFASITKDSDLDLAAYIFGACGCGFQVPESAMTEFENEKPWTATTGDPIGGHYVPLVGRNSKGLRFVVTWGRLQAVTDKFWQKYFLGGVAYFSPEYLLANGVSPEGIKEADLDTAIASL
jgi:hypothetical protein